MSGARTWSLRAALFAVAAGTLLPAGAVSAQEEAPGLGGYEGTAAASAVQLEYNPEGLLPIAAPVDLGVPDALATIGTGPATYARASVADPGDVLANPGALLSQAIEQYEAGTIPPYPFRVEVSSALGDPEASSTPAPGLASRARADGEGSRAEATMPSLGAPPVLTVGTQRAVATTAYDGSTVTVRSRAEVGGLDLLGLVRIESVVTDLTASSDGAETTISGGTTLVGAEVLGQPVTIDGDGIRLSGPSDAPLLSLLGLGDVGGLLEDLGIQITVDEPIEEEGRLVATGLRIELRLSPDTVPALLALKDVVALVGDLVPDAGLGELAGILDAHHVLTFEVGRGIAALTAQPGFHFEPTPIDIAQPPAPAPPVPSLGAAAPDLGAAPRPAPAAPGPSGGGSTAPMAPVASEPVGVPLGTGVGVAALLGLAVQPLLGHRLARASAAVLAPDTGTCPREGR